VRKYLVGRLGRHGGVEVKIFIIDLTRMGLQRVEFVTALRP